MYDAEARLTLSDDIRSGCGGSIEESSDMAVIVRIEIHAAFEVVDVITPYISLVSFSSLAGFEG
jgi:hypothetical protein